jgi:hypothetical protein
MTSSGLASDRRPVCKVQGVDVALLGKEMWYIWNSIFEGFKGYVPRRHVCCRAIDDGGCDHDLAVQCISPTASHSGRWSCVLAVLYFYIICDFTGI